MKPVSELSAKTRRKHIYRGRHLYGYLMFQHTPAERMTALQEMWKIEKRFGVKMKDIKTRIRRAL